MSVLYIILITVFVVSIYFDLSQKFVSYLVLRSTHKRWSGLRKLFWNRAKFKLVDDGYLSYKVKAYYADYLAKSIAARQYFINHGFVATRKILIGKIEELERFVEKYKYNTFDNLSDDEQDFIDKHLKE